MEEEFTYNKIVICHNSVKVIVILTHFYSISYNVNEISERTTPISSVVFKV